MREFYPRHDSPSKTRGTQSAACDSGSIHPFVKAGLCKSSTKGSAAGPKCRCGASADGGLIPLGFPDGRRLPKVDIRKKREEGLLCPKADLLKYGNEFLDNKHLINPLFVYFGFKAPFWFAFC